MRVLFFLLFFVPLFAAANIPKSGGGTYTVYSGCPGSPEVATVLEGCRQSLYCRVNEPGLVREIQGQGVNDDGSPKCLVHNYCTDGHCDPFDNQVNPTPITKTKPDLCPSYSHEDTVKGGCACDEGYMEDPTHTSCIIDPGKCGTLKGGYDLFNGSKMNLPGASYCPASGNGTGCAAVVNGAYAVVDKTTGSKVWTTEVKYTGDKCTPPSGSGSGGTSTGGSGSNDAPTPCKGQQGIVNGVTVCIPFGPSNPPSDTVTGSSKTNSDGSTTTTTDHTTCDGKNCTTTTTTTTTKPDSSGGTGGTGGTGTGTGTTTTTDTTTQDKPQNSFCKDNPDSPMCKSGSFGGDCGGGFTCDGDAIQCAIAQEQHRRNCQLFNPDNDPNSAVNKAMSGNDPGNVDVMKASAAGAPVGVGSFDFSGKSWSRSCPQDPIIPIPWGKAQEFTLPFSKLCGPLGLAADIAVAITALACMVFVVRVPQA